MGTFAVGVVHLEDKVGDVAVGGVVLDGEGGRGEATLLVRGGHGQVRLSLELLHEVGEKFLHPEALLRQQKQVSRQICRNEEWYIWQNVML